MAKTSRRPSMSPHSGEGRQIGLDDRELPGGLPHIGNAEVHETPAHKKPQRQLPSINEHRVPDRNPDEPYQLPEAGKILIPVPEKLPKIDDAVPVRIVEGTAPRVHRKALADNIQAPGNASDPMPVCGRDYRRIEVLLLNEDAANDIRVSEERSALLEGRGAILKHGATSYTTVKTQDELFVLSAAANPALLSVILVTEVND